MKKTIDQVSSENIERFLTVPGSHPAGHNLILSVTPGGRVRWKFGRVSDSGGPHWHQVAFATYPDVNLVDAQRLAAAARSIDEALDRATESLENDDLPVRDVVAHAHLAFEARAAFDGHFDPKTATATDRRSLFDDFENAIATRLPSQEPWAIERRNLLEAEVERQRNDIRGKASASSSQGERVADVTRAGDHSAGDADALNFSPLAFEVASIIDSMGDNDRLKAYAIVVRMSRGHWPKIT